MPSNALPTLTEINDYHASLAAFSSARLWELFDGNRETMNLAHECVDRHRQRGVAISVKSAAGSAEHITYAELADWSGRFANWLEDQGVSAGERVAIILEPGLAFYTCLFGAIKHGAIAVPLFTLFGPDGLALRIHDCTPSVIVTALNAAELRAQFPAARVVEIDVAWWDALASKPARYLVATRADDLCVFQYTSGTTRELPEAVRHTQRAVVTLMVAALYGVGLRPNDRYFCPSSPAWGHGLWHGTIAPLALGIHIAAYAGQFNPLRIFEALEQFEIDNFAAAATVYRMLKNCGERARFTIKLAKCSFTGEPLDGTTFDWIERSFGVQPASMYGTTEVGVIMVDYPGMSGHRIRRGALGKPAPGNEVAIIGADGRELADNALGEIAVKRRGQWFPVKDLGYRDADGYIHHAGRADDVIISSGWTMSAVEIENTLLQHQAVAEAAVIGIPDALRGQIAKAYIVLRSGRTVAESELQDHVRDRLSRHEHPRAFEFVNSLPKTPAGKINRKSLRALAARESSPKEAPHEQSY